MTGRICEGAFFLLPVETGQYGVGLIARAPRRGGILLGYFFGPRRTSQPDLAWLESRSAAQAVFVGRFRDKALFRGDWPVLHVMPAFERAQWPIPPFHRFDGSITISPGATLITDWRVEYGDDNLVTPVSERPASGAELRFRDDVAYDPSSLCREVGSVIVAAVPSADDNLWR